MSGLCGFASTSEIQNSQVILDEMLEALQTAMEEKTRGIGKSAAAAAAGKNIDTYMQDNLIVVILGRPTLSHSTHSIAKYLGEGYRSNGGKIFASLNGGFAAVIIDDQKKETVLAVDRMGIFSLTYTLSKGYLVFGTSADAIIRHPSVEATIDTQSLFNFVYFHMVPGPQTIYQGQQRILPGNFVAYKNGQVSVGPYWEMRYREDVKASVGDLKDEFTALLEKSVKDAANTDVIGTFLSGGTDSSTVSGILRRVKGEAVQTFSIGFDAQGFDEMEYARLAARHFDTHHHEYYVTPDDVIQAIPKIAAIYDQPFGNASAVPTYYCARMASSSGITRLLAGDGGDELFGGNARYAKQQVFSLYEGIPAVMRKLIVDPLALALPHRSPTPLRKIKSYIEQAKVPMPERLETYNLMKRLGAEKIFNPDFLASIDQAKPIWLLQQVYYRAQANTLINKMLALDLQFTLADNDLPKVSRTCDLAGIDVAFPLLSNELVEFSANLPARLKLKGTKLRYFFKEALRDFLPPQIITKAKHGFGLPFGIWLTQSKGLQELVNDSLNMLKARHIIKSDFIDELKSAHLSTHASYYGTMVWVLMMLEQWFDKHQISHRSSNATPASPKAVISS